MNYDLHDPATINFLIPEAQREAWMTDYTNMRRFFIYGKSPEFDALLQRMEELQARVRELTKRGMKKV